MDHGNRDYSVANSLYEKSKDAIGSISDEVQSRGTDSEARHQLHVCEYQPSLESANPSSSTQVPSPESIHPPQQLRIFHTLPTPTAQRVQRRISEVEARELARTEAASWAQMTPLMAAIFGPLSILLGIPSLTQRWHGKVLDSAHVENGVSNIMPLPDPALELALSAISLVFEILANTFLVLRFSNFYTKSMTWISYCFWIAKLILDIANYIQFGISHPETEEIIYLQGFWVQTLEIRLKKVGVCGMVITVIIIIFLTFNLAFLSRQSAEGISQSA